METTLLNTSRQSGEAYQFKFELLKKITNDFSLDRLIGRGAYGDVYEGVLHNGKKIAVKKLIYRPLDHDSEKQFQDECINLMRVQHENIVRLVGYCDETHRQCVEHGGKYVFAEENQRALCFEYLQGGSLDRHVSNEPCTLSWNTCYKIIRGICVGLNHLHNGYIDSIFHLDLKPANILLDNNMMPRIGDFGLSRLVSSTKTCITTTPLGTTGYTPPEFVDKQEISSKYDVFSLGVIIIHMMAGRKHYYDHVDNPSKIIELVCDIWEKRLDATMWSHASQEVKACIEVALRCVKSDRHERPTISNIVNDLKRIDTTKLSFTNQDTNLQTGEASFYNQYTSSVSMGVHEIASGFDSMEGIHYKREVSHEVGGNDSSIHDSMDSVHESNEFITRNLASHSIGGHASSAILERRDVTQTIDIDIDGHHRRNPLLRAEGNIHTPATMDTIGNLFQWARSIISFKWSGTDEKLLRDELFRLERAVQHLMDSLPAMYDLIDRAEWRSHKHRMAEYLAKLKDLVYDADDLLDEFRWYILKVKVDGNGNQSLSMDFFNNVIQGSFTKLVNGVQDRLDNISTHLLNMGLHEVTTRFDKSVRPETTSFPDETKIFGRDMELKKTIHFLCKPTNSEVNVSASTSSSNQVISESSIPNFTVLPIFGIGGVGKTTLAQHICSDAQVKFYFDLVIWICVSDDFDVKRLTKEVIDCCPGKQETTGNLNALQEVLFDIVSTKKLLLVLDDIWDDALKENGRSWKRFCAPLKNALQGSVILVTTRCQKVAEKVGTRDPIILEGLKDDVFWKFFKLCVFESGSSNKNDPELEHIGRSISSKLKGSPLAAKTLGRILRMNLEAKYWNAILESELWKLRQEETEILPALRLSYMYLPFHLKRCFSFCAVYPKDYIFQKGYLAKVWVAEGFVESQGDIPDQDIGCEYFDDLLHRSFFQKVPSGYVIHDLLHDMAQKVSEFDCFIIKRRSDLKSIPLNVRHLSVLSSTDIDYSDFLGLRRFTKIRTLICFEPLANKKTSPNLMAVWCSEFVHLRVIVCTSTHKLPTSIGNLKHLRYLQILGGCPFKSLPTEFCWLYNLQNVIVLECKLESLPTDFSKLICLQRFESHGFLFDSVSNKLQKKRVYYEVRLDAGIHEHGLGFRLIKNINQLEELRIYNIGMSIIKEDAAEAQLHNKKYLEKLILEWSLLRKPEDYDIDILRFLQPPAYLKSLIFHGYPGVSIPSLSRPENMPCLMSPSFISCDGLESSSVPRITELNIDGCRNLSSVEHVIHPAYIASLKKMTIKNCKTLASIPAELFCLEELVVMRCPNIYSQSLVAPFLKRLVLGKENDWTWSKDLTCGNLAESVDCCSLTYFFLACNYLKSIELHKWNLPALKELHISGCQHLTSIIGQPGEVIRGNGGIRALSSLTSLTIYCCDMLSTIDDLLTEEYLPVIVRIHVKSCHELLSLPSERFGNFSSLKELGISYCCRLSWRRGFVLPSSLQILSLDSCGDISAWVPSCLQNLASLVTLEIEECWRITSIPGHFWSSNLRSLENLMISNCADIVSIGGEDAISKIKNVAIDRCPKLEELEQPMLRGSYVES